MLARASVAARAAFSVATNRGSAAVARANDTCEGSTKSVGETLATWNGGTENARCAAKLLLKPNRTGGGTGGKVARAGGGTAGTRGRADGLAVIGIGGPPRTACGDCPRTAGVGTATRGSGTFGAAAGGGCSLGGTVAG